MPYRDPEQRKKAQREAMKRWRLANPEKEKAYKVEYRATHKELIKKYNSEYCANNLEKFREYGAEWRKNNPDKINDCRKRYRESHRAKLNNAQIVRNMGLTIGLPVKDIPSELIDAKLAILTVKRKVKELSK